MYVPAFLSFYPGNPNVACASRWSTPETLKGTAVPAWVYFVQNDTRYRSSPPRAPVRRESFNTMDHAVDRYCRTFAIIFHRTNVQLNDEQYCHCWPGRSRSRLYCRTVRTLYTRLWRCANHHCRSVPAARGSVVTRPQSEAIGVGDIWW